MNKHSRELRRQADALLRIDRRRRRLERLLEQRRQPRRPRNVYPWPGGL